MATQVILFLANIVLINFGFLCAFVIRYGWPFPERNFAAYRGSFMLLTLIYTFALALFKVFKSRFKSSWDLFKRVFLGLFLGTLFGVAFIYVYRTSWGAFPTSVFVLTFFISLLLIFKLDQWVLRYAGRIRKKIVVVGRDGGDEIAVNKADIERIRTDQIKDVLKCKDVDEIILCENIDDQKDLNRLLYLVQKHKIDVVFSPSRYMELLPRKINGENPVDFLSTFIGRKRDVEEFLIRCLDLAGGFFILLAFTPVMVIFSLLIKVTSPGPALYKQERTGKDGKIFTLYKFRTMIRDAEQISGLAPACENDPRVTKLGKWLRMTRLDELPQLLNVIKGEMSLVGPRPENLYRVEHHKHLQGLRLAVRPGITGLAQIRSYYDLRPKHKIKYDFLYIQRRSLLLNLYILTKTIPVIFLRKGW